ncbi:hypothetical protein CsSME_00044588 [Camellia sinensis var. sinensis]
MAVQAQYPSNVLLLNRFAFISSPFFHIQILSLSLSLCTYICNWV